VLLLRAVLPSLCPAAAAAAALTLVVAFALTTRQPLSLVAAIIACHPSRCHRAAV